MYYLHLINKHTGEIHKEQRKNLLLKPEVLKIREKLYKRHLYENSVFSYYEIYFVNKKRNMNLLIGKGDLE